MAHLSLVGGNVPIIMTVALGGNTGGKGCVSTFAAFVSDKTGLSLVVLVFF
jgi:hypothetical protein